jgi:hypothetical protein
MDFPTKNTITDHEIETAIQSKSTLIANKELDRTPVKTRLSLRLHKQNSGNISITISVCNHSTTQLPRLDENEAHLYRVTAWNDNFSETEKKRFSAGITVRNEGMCFFTQKRCGPCDPATPEQPSDK